MAKVTINNKEYELEKLPKEAVDLINSIRIVDAEVQRLQNQIKINLAARNFYFQELQKYLKDLPQDNATIKFPEN